MFLSLFRLGPIVTEDDEYSVLNGRTPGTNSLKLWYDRTKWIWVLFALASVVLQATRSAESSEEHLHILEYGELALTFLFDIDIVWRFLSYLPLWRTFFEHGNNWLDLLLAVASTIIQLPVIRDSDAYPWLTIFQLARFYRVILEVPRMRPLLVSPHVSLFLRGKYRFLHEMLISFFFDDFCSSQCSETFMVLLICLCSLFLRITLRHL